MNYELLTKAGVNVDSLLARLLGNAGLVRVFVQKFTEDSCFRSLVEAFEHKDRKASEMASHTLKGMCGNLLLNALYDLFTEQVNRIRCGQYEAAAAMMPEITEVYGAAVIKMREWLAEDEN